MSKDAPKVEKATPVDADKLWRDRVSSELLYQRSWEKEYGFMLDDAQRAQRAAASGALSSEQLKVSYKGIKSTQQSTFSSRPSLEQNFGQKEHNRRKHAPS
eukprot:PhF_6_TR39624/c0_g1_i1/m.58703